MKKLQIKTSIYTDSKLVGNYRTFLKGRGLEFEGFSEYVPGDSVRNIDFSVSSRGTKILKKDFIEEKDLKVYFFLDLDSSFVELEKKEKVLSDFLDIISNAVLSNGDRLGTYIKNNNKFFVAKRGRKNLKMIEQEINGLDLFIPPAPLKRVGNLVGAKSSLIFYISSQNDYLISKDIKKLSVKNDLVFVNIFDSFENDLDKKGVHAFSSNGNKLVIDLDDKKLKQKYVDHRNNKLEKIKKEFRKNKLGYIYLDDKMNVFFEINKFMKSRF